MRMFSVPVVGLLGGCWFAYALSGVLNIPNKTDIQYLSIVVGFGFGSVLASIALAMATIFELEHRARP